LLPEKPVSRLSAARQAVAAGFLTALAAACGGAASDPDSELRSDAAGEAVATSVALRVMSFNIEWGGTNVRFGSITDAIRAADADIVGIQEAEGNLARLAGELGWHYNLRNYVVSKYPVIDPPGADGKYVLIEVLPGKAVAIGNVHLPSSPSGAAWLRAGRTPAAVVAMERQIRLAPIRPVLDALPALANAALPVFLSGDLNSPSHEDWIEAAIGKFPYRDHIVPWPVTRAIAATGLRDSFRDIHPDPVANPGFTWWAARPEIKDFNPADPDARKRIDFLWYGGPAKVTDSRLVGEAGAAEVSVSITPWPSDHRAIVSDFDVTPGAMPPLVASERRVHTSGSPLRFVFHNKTPGGSLVIERHGEHVVTERRIAVESALGRIRARDDFLSPGFYQVVLQDRAGDEVSRNDFWILAPEAKPAVTVTGERFARGEPLPVAWQNAPGNRHDWIGVYEADAAENQDYRAWGYVGARSSGDMQLSASNSQDGRPLSPGRYVARLLLDDGYALLAESAPFVVD
jgi:endonuclease/exonuclease/phosphatase family metal-dependent hydrolase